MVSFSSLTDQKYVVHVLRKSVSRVPGPWYTRWTDVGLRYTTFYGRRGQYVHQLHEKYGTKPNVTGNECSYEMNECMSDRNLGPVVRVGPNQVDICDIKAFKTIYATREVFVKSPWYRVLTGDTVDGLFTTSDPNYHRRLRRFLSAPLSEASLVSSHGLCQRKAKLAVRRMRDEMEETGAADVYKWWMFMTTDIIGELTFGKSFDMLAKSEVCFPVLISTPPFYHGSVSVSLTNGTRETNMR